MRSPSWFLRRRYPYSRNLRSYEECTRTAPLAASKKTDRDTKEVEAEAVAYTVLQYLGLDSSDYSFGYIAGWAGEKEVPQLKKSLDVIRRTANTIIEGLEAA